MGETFPQTAKANPYALEWSGILFPEEKILWQGQPYAGVKLHGSDTQKVVMGLICLGLLGFTVLKAVNGESYSWLFGAISLFMGLFGILSPILIDPFVRKHTFYTLTTERAFIAKDLPFLGKKLDSHPISKFTPVSFEDADFASINFATREKMGRRGSIIIPVGFELIPDGRKVFALFRQIQSEAK